MIFLTAMSLSLESMQSSRLNPQKTNNKITGKRRFRMSLILSLGIFNVKFYKLNTPIE